MSTFRLLTTGAAITTVVAAIGYAQPEFEEPGERPERGRPRFDDDRGRPPRPPAPEQVFDEMDADGDGSVTREEFMEHHERFGPPGPPPPRGPRGREFGERDRRHFGRDTLQQRGYGEGRGFEGRERGFGPPGPPPFGRDDFRGSPPPPRGRGFDDRGPRRGPPRDPDGDCERGERRDGSFRRPPRGERPPHRDDRRPPREEETSVRPELEDTELDNNSVENESQTLSDAGDEAV